MLPKSPAAMELKYQSTTTVKPEGILHKKVPLTIFDKAAADLHIQVLLVYKRGTASNAKIKDALSKVLTHYPMLVGKLSGDKCPAVYLDDESGVPVTETAVAGDLDDFLPLEPSPALAVLCPEAQGTNPLFLVQLNRFDCGGLVMGVSCNHKVHDGQAISNFFVSWSEMVRDQPVRVLPVHDQSLLRPRNPPAPEFPHEEMEFCTVAAPDDHDAPPPKMLDGPIENVVVHYSSEFIRKVKERVGSKHSTFVCMLAHLWKKVTVARGLGEEEVTSAKVSVSGRPRLGVPGAYFGNLVLTAFPTAKATDLVQEPLGYIADLIREAVEKVGSDYFQSVIDFGELNKDKELYPSVGMGGNTLCPDLEVDSWLGFQFHELDMGGGAPCAFLPTWIPVEGILIIMPSPMKNKGQKSDQRWGAGIDVILTLSADHAKTFKQIAHSLD